MNSISTLRKDNGLNWGEALLACAPGCYPGRWWFESTRPSHLHMKYKVGDIVLVNSFAGPKVSVKLKKRLLKPKDNWGADGWDAQIIYKKDVDSLRNNGVPYKQGEKPIVFVFDWQIIKKKR